MIICSFVDFAASLNKLIWGHCTLAAVLFVGITYTLRLHCIQIKHFGLIFKTTIGSIFKTNTPNVGLTPFQVFSTALGSTVGVGSIAGVAGAIALGGPGAVFWMLISAFFGMATKYAEILLSVKHRHLDINGQICGGPMYYMEFALKAKAIAVIFSFFGCMSCFISGAAAQSAEITASIENLTGGYISAEYAALFLTLCIVLISSGGITRIGSITSILVPIMTILYISLGIYIVFNNIELLPNILSCIASSALSPASAAGGIGGYTAITAIRRGLSRGIFSNEAGLGTAPIAHGASNDASPTEQGFWGIFEVLFTAVICAVTGIVVIISGKFTTGLSGGLLASASFEAAVPFGNIFVGLAVILFAFTTVIGWEYYGEQCWGYIFKKRSSLKYFKAIYFSCCCLGGLIVSFSKNSSQGLNLIWELSDICSGLMMLPNLAAVFLLSNSVINETKSYFNKQRPGH